MESVLLDTDIGSDIDDAIALAYLLQHPKCHLMGITTVSGDVQKRAALAETVCRAANRLDIPIHCGRRNVLFNGNGQPNVPQFEVIEKDHPKLDRQEDSAVEFLRQTIRRHPNQINLLSIGPFSNIAILFAIDPEIPQLLKSFTSMAGVFFHGDRREWNCLCDPTANAMVYSSVRKSHVSIGLDVTEKCTMNAEEVRSKFSHGPLLTVSRFAETWFKGNGHVTFHDPLAASVIFNPEFCKYKSGSVTTTSDTNCEQVGQTIFREGAGPDRVAFEVDPQSFFKDFFEICT